MLGANLPWVSYGGDFGANAWRPGGGLASSTDRSRLNDALLRLSRQGIRSVRWFMLCDGRAGIVFGSDGGPLGLDDRFFSDVDAALLIAREHGVTILFVLLDFLLCNPRDTINGVQVGGRRHLLTNADARKQLLDRVIAPILIHYGNDETIEGWDLINEPEWCTFGSGSWNPLVSIARRDMRAYISEASGLVHQHTRHPVTVGLASGRWLDLVQDLDLDVFHVHWYDRTDGALSLEQLAATWQVDRPIVLGEFPTRGSARAIHDVLDAAHHAGFSGAYLWSVLSNDTDSDFSGSERMLAAWMTANSQLVNA